MTSEVRAPYKRRERRSRPSVSVPSQYLYPGGNGAPSNDRPSNGWASGEEGASHGAARAANTTAAIRSTATQVAGWRAISASARFIPLVSAGLQEWTPRPARGSAESAWPRGADD